MLMGLRLCHQSGTFYFAEKRKKFLFWVDTREEELIDTTKSYRLCLLNSLGAFMKGWRYGLLIFELFLFALILVLPQVDLPDFTFPGGTAPIAARSKLSPPSAFSAVLDHIHARSLEHLGETRSRVAQPEVQMNPLSPVTQTCLLRC
jgi:hypothetical protein